MKVLIAGFGSIGRRHFRNLQALGDFEYIFYRTHQSSLDDRELDHHQVETDLEAALDHSPDLVIVSNPTAYHLEVAIPAAERGCDILLEKPVSHSLSGTGALQSAAARSGSKILVGFQFRFHPGINRIRSWVQNEEIGKVYFVRAHWGEYLPAWHPWEDYRKGYSAVSGLGGGVILTLSHPIDYLFWIFGKIVDVQAKLGFAKALDIEVEELVDAHLRFESGILANVHLNYLQQPPAHTLEIIGSQGSVTWDFHSGELRRYLVKSGAWEHFSPPEKFERNDLFMDEMRHFLAVHRNQEEPICTLEEGIQVQKILEAVRESSFGSEVQSP